MYDRSQQDRYQALVTAAHGAPLNPQVTGDGVIRFQDPKSGEIFATVKPGYAYPDIEQVEWEEGVPHDNSRTPDFHAGWAPYINRTEKDNDGINQPPVEPPAPPRKEVGKSDAAAEGAQTPEESPVADGGGEEAEGLESPDLPGETSDVSGETAPELQSQSDEEEPPSPVATKKRKK